MNKELFFKRRLEEERRRLHVRVTRWMNESLGCAKMAETATPESSLYYSFMELSEVYKGMALDAYEDYEYIRDAKYKEEAADRLLERDKQSI